MGVTGGRGTAGAGPGRDLIYGSSVACASHWAGWACRGAWDSPRWVCAGCRVLGVVRGVGQVGLWRACAVVWEAPVAGAGGVCYGPRVWASGWAAGGEGHVRGLRAGVCCVGVCVRSQQRACMVSCRPGRLEEELAVFCGRG